MVVEEVVLPLTCTEVFAPNVTAPLYVCDPIVTIFPASVAAFVTVNEPIVFESPFSILFPLPAPEIVKVLNV